MNLKCSKKSVMNILKENLKIENIKLFIKLDFIDSFMTNYDKLETEQKEFLMKDFNFKR